MELLKQPKNTELTIIFYEFTFPLKIGHLEKLLVSDKSHMKRGKIHLFAKGFLSGLVGLGEKFEFSRCPIY
jgi:hypothetical protein